MLKIIESHKVLNEKKILTLFIPCSVTSCFQGLPSALIMIISILWKTMLIQISASSFIKYLKSPYNGVEQLGEDESVVVDFVELLNDPVGDLPTAFTICTSFFCPVSYWNSRFC